MEKANARRYGLIAAVVLLLSSLLVYRPSDAGLWWQALFEWLHVPVFGLIAITLLALTPASWFGWRRFGVALAASLVLALLTEAAQIPLARSASMKDIISDMAGAAAFLLGAIAVRSRLAIALPTVLVALAILSSSALPLISMSRAFLARDARFPVLFAGDAESTPDFVLPKNAGTETGWDRELGQLYTRVLFPANRQPGIQFIELYPDWTGYEALNLHIEVETDARVSVTIRVHDKAHRRGSQPHSDRFNRRVALDPGYNLVSFPLADIKNAPRGRSMDMTQIEALVLFSAAADAERVLRLYEVRLD